MRHLFPLLWEEHHELSAENPVFNSTAVVDPDGVPHLSPSATLKSRRLCLSGWLYSFPYRLYDSYQMLAMEGDPTDKQDKKVKSFGWVPFWMKKEKYPTFKKILGMKRADAEVPPKIVITDRKLPIQSPPVSFAMRQQYLHYTSDQLIDLMKKKPTMKRRKLWGSSQSPSKGLASEPLREQKRQSV